MMLSSVLLAIQFTLVVAYHENSIAAGERRLNVNVYEENQANINRLVLNGDLVVNNSESVVNGTDENNDEQQNQFVFDLPNFDWLNHWLNGSWMTNTGQFLQNFGRNVSNECLGDLRRMADAHATIATHLTIRSIRFFTDKGSSVSETASSDQHLWALKIINSFGAHTPGIFHQGQFLLYGSYAQCIETKIPHGIVKTRPRKKKSSNAQYCMLTIQNPLEETKENRHPAKAGYRSYPRLKYGSCWPPSCIRDGNNVIAEHLSGGLVKVFSAVTNLSLTHRVHCQPSIENKDGRIAQMTNGQLCFLVFSSFLLTVIVVGTAMDFWPKCCSINNRKKNVDFKRKRSKIRRRLHHNSLRCEVESTSSISSLGSSKSINRVILIDLESIISYKSTRSLSEKVRQVKWWKRVFLAFSLRTNVRWLLQTSHDKNTSSGRYSNRIKCLFGLKTLTAIWVVVGHTYIFSLPHTSNMAYVARILPDQIFAQIILNSTLSVDTFFLISGLLTAYVCTKRAANSGASVAVVKWLVYYVHRLFRLLPPYAFVLFFALTLFDSLGHGPRWDPESMPEVQCSSPHSWWRHLTFMINMFDVDPSALCMPWMWYLAVDFQMYVVSPIFLIMLQKIPKIGICFIILCVLTSSIVQGIWTSIHRLPTNMILFLPDEHFDNDLKRHFETVYQKTYFRCGPYLIGLLLGWALADGRIKSRRCRFSLWQKTALFLSTFGFCFWALFGAFPLMSGPFSGVYNGIYATLNRMSWCIGIALLIYVCEASRESHMINNLLSAKFFWPLSRVTYSNYLSHELLILYTYYSLQNPITFENHWSILRHAAFFICSSYFTAFLLFLLIEGPILSAERLLFRRKPKNLTPPGDNGDVTLVSHKRMTEQWVESLQEFEGIAQEYDNINEDDKN